MKKIWWVARKNWREILREPQMLGLTLALPLIFMLVTKLMYPNPLLTTQRVLYFAGSQGGPLIAALQAEHYADGQPVFLLEPAESRAAADAALKSQAAAAVLTVAEDGVHATVEGDATAVRFYRAGVSLNEALSRYAMRAAGQSTLVQLTTAPFSVAAPTSEFDLYAPGMMMFALLLIIPQTAMLVGRELRWRTLRRLQLTRLSIWEFLGGISLAQLAIAVLQVLAMFGSAMALGFQNHGSLAMALLVGLIVAFSAIGLGILVACFVENDSQATNVGSTFSMVQVFISGSFFALPPMTVFTVGGYRVDLFDFTPATHGFLALQQALCYGAGLQQIGFRLILTVALSLLYFGLGVALFRRKLAKSG